MAHVKAANWDAAAVGKAISASKIDFSGMRNDFSAALC